jgi:hypothetical protein
MYDPNVLRDAARMLELAARSIRKAAKHLEDGTKPANSERAIWASVHANIDAAIARLPLRHERGTF